MHPQPSGEQMQPGPGPLNQSIMRVQQPGWMHFEMIYLLIFFINLNFFSIFLNQYTVLFFCLFSMVFNLVKHF
jgi:hypothetical protein